jgi:hypothetical protein
MGNNLYLKRLTIPVLIISLLVFFVVPISPARAANVTGLSDTLDTLVQNVAANHTILFVTPTGVESSTDTITIDFTDLGMGSVAFGDIDLAEDDDGNCDGPWTDKTLAATAAAGTWGAAIASSVLTLTAPTDAASGEITAGRCVQIQIGTNAAGGSNQFTNPNNTNTHVFAIAGTFGDSGKFALDFVADDSVLVTGVVDSAITFSISDTDVGFGTLDSSQATYATADGTGTTSAPVVTSGAHELVVTTNATGGYVVTYNTAATLTSGSDTITATTGITNDLNGTPGTEEFGLAAATANDATIAAGYDYTGSASTSDWDFVSGSAQTLFSETGPTNTETVDVFYLANIAGTTEAGTYTTTFTYTATGTF